MKVSALNAHNHHVLSDFPRLLSDELGTFPDYEHVIAVTDDAIPSAKKLRPVPLSRRQATEKEVALMDKVGIWEKVDKSQWVHPLVTVNKPNGEVRITTDLSPLNRFMTPDRFPLPNPKDLFLELRGATVFSKLDLRKAFFHVELAPESRSLTTTLTHQGLRQYCRLPMGLKDTASVCQRLVSQTLAGCPGTIAYIDDILVFVPTQADHDCHLREALQRLQSKDFRLQISKCEFSVSRTNFLGNIISADGITPDPKNVQPILDAPTPKTLKQVQSFLVKTSSERPQVLNRIVVLQPW
ncbi:RNA-directed DNA polymerase (Reverse transcriptase) domain containing protein [Elysia marginata]|uniref:RNA-directed DNA polymerase (Reverse transcriptase) domain containing protein n=1 Tax=Elysia marginata TaxID=1093978 RepID=A0AAV4GDK3_9GAST|nr:RNA-directed DNA polymerase (Reverse transcriptase) domain containing protein [Elysia marginata]